MDHKLLEDVQDSRRRAGHHLPQTASHLVRSLLESGPGGWVGTKLSQGCLQSRGSFRCKSSRTRMLCSTWRLLRFIY